MNIIDVVEKEQMKKATPRFSIGDQVDVSVKIIEGDKERIQVFSGVVIARNGGGFKETLPSDVLFKVKAWSEYSLFIHRRLLILRS